MLKFVSNSLNINRCGIEHQQLRCMLTECDVTFMSLLYLSETDEAYISKYRSLKRKVKHTVFVRVVLNAA